MTDTIEVRQSDRVTSTSSPQRGRRRQRISTLARHEYRSATRSRILIVLLGILVCVTAVSVFIASIDYRSQITDYRAYVASAQAGGVARIAPSPLRPLSLLRGATEYLEIIGAVISITLGYLTVARERSNRTLTLLRSRPVTAGEQATGSLLGALGIIITLVAVTGAVGVLLTGIIGNDWINAAQALRLLLAGTAAVIYMTVFYCVGAVATARSRVAATGLLVALGIWLLVVLIIPQLGDTLDADNQIPGGLFKALGLNRDGETQILAHFHTYETTRVGIEEASFAKHYERFSFAMTDVLDKYRDFTLGQLLHEKWHDIAWLIAYPTVALAALWQSFRHQPTIPTGDQS